MSRNLLFANSHGKDLERAVKGIEEVIYRNQPELRGRTVELQGNWRFKHVRAGHEIDLLVKVDAGTASEEKHVYECKNRQEPTDKDAIIVLIYKLNAVGAKSGMVIARRFTSGAEAIAASRSSDQTRVLHRRVHDDLGRGAMARDQHRLEVGTDGGYV